jgi:hypothetical protein
MRKKKLSPSGSPSPLNSGFSQFLARHNRVLILLGQLIVFTTFIVREGVRENLKDFVDSLDSAQGIFMLQRENSAVSTHLTEIYRAVSATYTNVLSPPPGGIPQLDLLSVELHFQDASDSIQRLKDELGAAQRLLERVPHSKQEEEALTQFGVRYNEASKHLGEYVLPGSATPMSDLQKSFNSALAIEHEIWNVETELITFMESILRESLDVKAKDERYFEIATWSSYGLYTLGWGLALFGKLYDPKGGEFDGAE